MKAANALDANGRVIARYRVSCDPERVEAWARAIAIEQSVETPVETISSGWVRDQIVGRVEDIADAGGGAFLVRIGLAAATTGDEPGQLLNMLFGNSSIHENVSLEDAELPASLLEAFGGPRVGVATLRNRTGAQDRALTCAAIKPQGLTAEALADLAGRFALGGVDFIKDDHGLADQWYAPFADRVKACAGAVRAANARTGGQTRYAPNLSGSLDALRRQIAIAREEGLDTALIAPMVVGLPAFHAVARENPDVAFIAHPAMAGGARIAPPLLIGKLFRLFGASAVIFPNHGGRFGYSPAVCRALALAARQPWGGLAASLPTPAGGMSVERVPEMLEFHGRDSMLLIGGALLAAGAGLSRETANFVRRVTELSSGRVQS